MGVIKNGLRSKRSCSQNGGYTDFQLASASDQCISITSTTLESPRPHNNRLQSRHDAPRFGSRNSSTDGLACGRAMSNGGSLAAQQRGAHPELDSPGGADRCAGSALPLIFSKSQRGGIPCMATARGGSRTPGRTAASSWVRRDVDAPPSKCRMIFEIIRRRLLARGRILPQ